MVQILLVDDHADYLGVAGEGFQRLGYNTSKAMGLEDAEVFCRAQRYDVIVSDRVLFEGARGLKVLGDARAKNENLVIVAMTGVPTGSAEYKRFESRANSANADAKWHKVDHEISLENLVHELLLKRNGNTGVRDVLAPGREAIDSERVVRVLRELGRDRIELVESTLRADDWEELPMSGGMPTSAYAAELVRCAEENNSLERLVCVAHRTFPESGILRRVLSDVAVVDRDLEIAFREHSGSEVCGEHVATAHSIPMIVRTTDEKWNIERDIRGFRRTARIGKVVSGLGTRESLEDLKRDPRVTSVEPDRAIWQPEVETSLPLIKAQDAQIRHEERGDKAIVAIIDSGIDVLHEAFRDVHGGSRIIALWDQFDETGPPPKGFHIGTLHTQKDIDRYIRQARVPPSLGRDPIGHGTHVASIAAGRATSKFPGGVAPEARIIAVVANLDSQEGDPSGVRGSTLVAALDFIRRFARKRRRPVVVNASFGVNAGAHDGTSTGELIFDAFSKGGIDPGLVVVKSAGNERCWAGHARVTLQEHGEEAFEWVSESRLRAQDRLEFWYEPYDEASFTLVNPKGEESKEVDWSTPEVSGTYPGGNRYCVSLVRHHRDNGCSRVEVIIYSDFAGVVEAGTWELRARCKDISTPLMIHGWIERHESRAICFSTHVDEEVTISIPGTAKNVITVGAVEKTYPPLRVGRFSSYGPTRDGRKRPDVVAPGVEVSAAASETSNDVRVDSGTSMAAPHVAGAIALLLSRSCKNPTIQQLNLEQVRRLLHECTRGTCTQWERGTGYGLIDIDCLLAGVVSGMVKKPD
jgi:subtilisin family serine protease/CheY-like chemotaxis protein